MLRWLFGEPRREPIDVEDYIIELERSVDFYKGAFIVALLFMAAFVYASFIR